MKKLFIFAMAITICSVLQAENLLVLNQEQKCEVRKTYPTKLEAKQALRKAKNYMSKDDFMIVPSEETEDHITFEGSLQTEYKINPFAGTFTKKLLFNGTLTITDKGVELYLTNFKIVEGYIGYGEKTTVNDVVAKLDELAELQAKLANEGAQMKKKEQKELKGQIEDIEDLLQESDEELQKRLGILATQLQ